MLEITGLIENDIEQFIDAQTHALKAPKIEEVTVEEFCKHDKHVTTEYTVYQVAKIIRIDLMPKERAGHVSFPLSGQTLGVTITECYRIIRDNAATRLETNTGSWHVKAYRVNKIVRIDLSFIEDLPFK